jgi:Phage integrase family
MEQYCQLSSHGNYRSFLGIFSSSLCKLQSPSPQITVFSKRPQNVMRWEINRLTQKRRKRVILPIHQELFFALEVERDRQNPQSEDHVLLSPETNRPLTRPRLYQRILALGRRAEVLDAHPYRFRDSFAVDLLSRGASPYDVAKLLGDTVDTIEKHYAPFVRELRERARRIMETGEGLEITGTQQAQEKASREEYNENKRDIGG